MATAAGLQNGQTAGKKGMSTAVIPQQQQKPRLQPQHHPQHQRLFGRYVSQQGGRVVPFLDAVAHGEEQIKCLGRFQQQPRLPLFDGPAAGGAKIFHLRLHRLHHLSLTAALFEAGGSAGHKLGVITAVFLLHSRPLVGRGLQFFVGILAQ